MAVTLTGAFGSAQYSLIYDLTDTAYLQAQTLITSLDGQYNNAVIYTPDEDTPHKGALIIGSAVANNVINAAGFGAVIAENDSSSTTIHGGTAGGDQVVLASNGGLTFRYTANGAGNVTVDAGGGANLINVQADAGTAAVYTGDGNDTIYAAQGSSTIWAGSGNNLVRLGAGADLDYVTGNDRVYLGSGQATVSVSGSGSADVFGATSISGSGYSLVFVGGADASTVHAGAGSYSITGGVGGGMFSGGSAGNNYIAAGTGNATISGGGSGDTLIAGAGTDLLKAGIGNETLIGGSGDTTFKVVTGAADGAGTVITIQDFNPNNDVIEVGGGYLEADTILKHYTVVNGSDTFTLQDGTQVVLQGYAGHLTQLDLTGKS
jgi:Ca2+-binding RTX toxin-like protein